MGLVGDPTLRLHSMLPPGNVVAVSGAGGVALTWQASADATLGYHVYVATSSSGPFTRLTGGATSTANPAGSPLAPGTLTYTHSAAVAGTTYTYLVKAVKLESSASGSYVNTSVGEMAQVTYQSPSPVPPAPTGLTVTGTGSTNFALTWQDNATDETSYEVEWRNPSTNVWSQVASLPPNTTAFTHNGATAGLTNHYRVRAVNANGPSAYTPATTQYNLPGLVDARNDFVQGSRTAGSVAVPFRRFSGSQGAVGATYSTTAVLGVGGVDFAAPSGTATWPHGVTSDSNVNVTIPALSGPQLTSIFHVDVSSTSGGLGLSNGLRAWVQIGDPSSQTLPSPWFSSAIGVTGAGYSEQVAGTFGTTVRSGDIAAAADSFRFTYRAATGDCRVTARISYLSPMASGIRAGVMIREQTSAGSRMNSILGQIGGSVRRVYRTANNGTADNALIQTGLPDAVWVRAIRTGGDLATQYSSDGAIWNDLGTPVTLTAPNSLMVVGLAMCSNNTVAPEVWGYARFDNVEVLLTPAVPASFTAASTANAGEVALSWNAATNATQYSVERSTQSGTGFTEIATTTLTSFTDQGLTGGQTYYYRVRAANEAFNSTYTSQASAAPLAVIDAWRLAQFGTASNSGSAADLADFDGDGLSNLVEYVLGQPPKVPGLGASPVIGQTTVGAQKFVTLTFARKLSATGVTLWVDAADSPAGSWTPLDPLNAVNQVSVQNNVPAAGWQTLTIKDIVPMQGATSRYLRLRVTRP